jgi:hypothetical protein
VEKSGRNGKFSYPFFLSHSLETNRFSALRFISQKWTTLIDLVPLKVFPKQVAPLEEQDHLETRRVWSPVCEALYKKDWNAATREKQRIEQEQRDKAELRKKNGET